MSKPANKTVIGVFVVVAICLVIGAVLVIGTGRLFKENPKFVMYFQGSVSGLSVGSGVMFRGVKVGNVTEIKMLFDPKDVSITIPVYVELEPGELEAAKGTSVEAYIASRKHGKLVRELIDRGLRARLEMQSIVTGQLLVALDFYPDKPATFIGADPKTPEIPTITTPLQELSKRLEKIPLEEIVGKLNAALGGIERIANSPDTVGAIRSAKLTVDETRSVVLNVGKQVQPLADRMTAVVTRIEKLAAQIETNIEPLASSVTRTSEEAQVTLTKAQSAIDNIQDLTGEDSPVSYQFEKTLDELGTTARSLRLLADTLNEQPEALVFGKKRKGGR
jgi:paraquat-inducible protein B